MLAESLGWGDDVFVVPHPVLEPVGRAVEVSLTHQRQRLRHQQQVAAQAGLELPGFLKRPGSLPVALPMGWQGGLTGVPFHLILVCVG